MEKWPEKNLYRLFNRDQFIKPALDSPVLSKATQNSNNQMPNIDSFMDWIAQEIARWNNN